MSDFIDVLAASELSPGDMKQVDVEGAPVLLANVDGQVFAIGAICTHEEEPLVEGDLDDDCVVCCAHFASFSLRDGSVKEGPAEEPEPSYPVKVENGRILVNPKPA